MWMNKNQEAFFALVRAGLWEKEVRLLPSDIIDFREVLRIAEEQSVVGLLAAGIDHVENSQVPQGDVLTIAGKALQIEQRNVAMNQFAAQLFSKLQSENINALLVKGQGLAQCYRRPLWRTAGDIDLLLDEDYYEKAKSLLIPLSDHVETEDIQAKHQGLTIKGFLVELHGRMPFTMSERVDRVVEDVLKDSLSNVGNRIWNNAGTEIYLPKVDNDVIIVFTHLLHHFFIEGVGLRQICDWCRLLWTYRNELDKDLLGIRLREMGLMSEWKVFGAMAVDSLGLPRYAMPFYDAAFRMKGAIALKRVMKSGNFGHNNDLNYRARYTGKSYQLIAVWRRFWDFASLIPIFPVDAPKFFISYLYGKVN